MRASWSPTCREPGWHYVMLDVPSGGNFSAPRDANRAKVLDHKKGGSKDAFDGCGPGRDLRSVLSPNDKRGVQTNDKYRYLRRRLFACAHHEDDKQV